MHNTKPDGDRYDFLIRQPVGIRMAITVRQPDGTPANLAGYSAAGQIFKGVKALNRYNFSFEFAADRATGMLWVVVPAALANSIPYGKYLYEIHLIQPNQEPAPLLYGEVLIATAGGVSHASHS